MVGIVKRLSGGLRTARPAALVSLVALLLAGCGTHMPGSAAASAGSSSSAAASAVSTGPQLGLVWLASDSTLRPLLGVPGAARLGAPLFAPGAYANAAYSPVSQSALLLNAKGDLQLLALPSLQPSTVTRGIASGALIAFSPQGRYAAVYTPGASSLSLLSGLPLQPIAANVTAPAAIRGAAVSDQGSLLIASGPSSGSLTVTSIASGARSNVAALQGYGGMAFLPASEDFLLADSLAATVTRYHAGTATTLATRSSGLAHPFAIAASLDAHWAVVAAQGSGTLLRLDLTGATPPVSSSCNCSPAQLLPLTGNALFELAAPTASPGWMIEADDALARVLFIPAARSGQ